MTTAFEAKRRLIALLQASVALTGVQIRYGPVTRETQTAGDTIWFHTVLADETQDWASLGALQREERYDLPLRAWTYKSGDDAQGTEARMEAIVNAIGAAIVGDHTLGGLCASAQIRGMTITTEAVGENQLEGWTCTWEGAVSALVRIRP